jgi:hypothetical protein
LHCSNGPEGVECLILKGGTISLADAMLHCNKRGWPGGPAAHK